MLCPYLYIDGDPIIITSSYNLKVLNTFSVPCLGVGLTALYSLTYVYLQSPIVYNFSREFLDRGGTFACFYPFAY